jgi:hypothetical protein
VERSLILSGTYVGSGLDLKDSIVDRHLLVNVAHGTSVNVLESFLLGGLSHPYYRSWLARVFSSVAAALLILMLLPITLFAIVYHALIGHCYLTAVRVPEAPLHRYSSQSSRHFWLPCLGSDAWAEHRPAGWQAFCRQLLPGLWAVLLGHIALVGLPPRTAEQIEQLEPGWKPLYEESRMGLISEASVVATREDEATQFYLCDAYYVARKSWRHDLGLVWTYARKLVVA